MSKYSPEEREAILRQAREHVANREPLSDAARFRKLERILDEQQRERAPIIRKVHDDSREPEPVPEQTNPDWWTLIDQRIEQRINERLAEEREFLLEVMGQSLGEFVADMAEQQEKSSKLKAEDVRALRIDLADTRAAFQENIREMREAVATKKGEPRPERSVN
jgi:hypothetical protein